MDTKDLRGLMEAYSEVYAPQEVDEATAMAKRGYDETKLRQRAGGGEAADRASALEKKSTFGDANKANQRQRLARAQRGDFRNTASSNPGLHGGQHKSDDPKVKAKQAARGAQRGALTPNERKQLNMGDETFDIFDTILEFLYVEGYAETLEEAEWMMANLIDEEAVAIILGEEQLQELSNRTVSNALNARIAATGAASDRAYKHRNPQAMRAAEAAADKEARMKGAVARRRARMNTEEYVDEGVPLRGTTPDGKPWRVDPSPSRPRQPVKMERDPKAKTSPKAGLNKSLGKGDRYEAFESWLDEAMTNYEKNRKRAAQRAAARNAARAQGKTGAVPGVGYVTPRKERETWTDESGKTRHAKGL